MIFFSERRFVKFRLFIWKKSIIIEKGLVAGNAIYFDSFKLIILENNLGKEWNI